MSKRVHKKVTEKSRTKALMGNFKRCTVKNPHPHITCVMSKVDVWHFLIGVHPDSKDGKGGFDGNDGEFKEGQFLGKIVAPKDYPYSPPNVTMYTPTGVILVENSNFCIDIGKYHKDDYPATLGMDGYLGMVWSGVLVGWKGIGRGIGLATGKTSHDELLVSIKNASKNSQAFNKKRYPRILKMFKSDADDADDSDDSNGGSV
jgi:ubiquitin-protein ligase